MPPLALRTTPSARTGRNRLRLIAAAALCAVFMSGCSWIASILPKVYRPDIQQGSVVTQEMVAQLRPGLTREQVKFVLGSPPIADPFHLDRWDYPYRLQAGKTGAVDLRHFTVYFDSDKMTRFEGDPVPTEQQFVESRIRLNAEANRRANGGDESNGPSLWQRIKGWFGGSSAPAPDAGAPSPPTPPAPPTTPGPAPTPGGGPAPADRPAV